MRLIALFGLTAGGILAAGQLTAAQWHAAGVAALALTVRYGLTVLPWALAAAFAWRYWRWKRTALAWISYGKMEMANYQRRKEDEWNDLQAKIRKQASAPRRKRATR
jgi:hypothetical protein